MIVVLRIILLSLLHPIDFIRKFSFSKIRVLGKAIRYESVHQIINNYRRYIEDIPVADDKVVPFSRDDFLQEKQERLEQHLKCGEKLEFFCSSPELTIIMVLYNKAELTFSCLESLLSGTYQNYELIIVDNHSTDQTSVLLDRISGAKILRNNENLHFIKANNQALPLVRGQFLLFLNNDTELQNTTLERAVHTLKTIDGCGAVGGKIILPEGFLQEAGSIVWSDGSCLGYGRHDDPSLPPYNFMRVTDYCSGAFLLTHTHLFKVHGGFDPLFEPAYYEETDYCLWLQYNGYKVIYDPQVVFRHFEFGSGVSEKAIALHQINQKKFFEKHQGQLGNHCFPDLSMVQLARFATNERKKKRILYIDDRVPHIDFGSGFPRSNSILNTIASLDFQVTLYPLNFPFEDTWDVAYRDIDPFIEIMVGYGLNRFEEFIHDRNDYFDVIWVSRPHNMKAVKKYLVPFSGKVKIVYDAEAIFAEREIRQMILNGKNVNQHKAAMKEVKLAEIADVVTSISLFDAEKFKKYGVENIVVLGHSLDAKRTDNAFDQREGLLFVGNLDYDGSPNVDSILWFIDRVWPYIRKAFPSMTLDIIGSNKASTVQNIRAKGVTVHGRVDDLSGFYNKCRLFIAPTRFAAGIPFKIHEAAAYGLPSVATLLLAGQLGWKNGIELWACEANENDFASTVVSAYSDARQWQNIQASAWRHVESEMSHHAYRLIIKQVLLKDERNGI